jgi:hypothetical protein
MGDTRGRPCHEGRGETYLNNHGATAHHLLRWEESPEGREERGRGGEGKEWVLYCRRRCGWHVKGRGVGDDAL